jgi:hypothetical protein
MQPETAKTARELRCYLGSTAQKPGFPSKTVTLLADNFMRNSENSKSVPGTQAWRSLLATQVRPEWPMPALPDRGWQST